jgi:ABC-2 type transport system permease protein
MYGALVRFSVSKALEFRFDFFFRFIMDCVYYAVTIGFFKILYLHAPTLGGWREDQTLIFLAIALVIDGVYMTMIARNIWELPNLINKGELDYHIVRPTFSLFFPLFKNFELASLMNVVVGLVFFTYAAFNFQEELTVFNMLLCFLLGLVGLMIYVCLRLFSVLPVFWTQSALGFHMLFEALANITERPEVIFRGVSHFILVTVMPFLVVTSFPARAIFGEVGILDIFHALVVLVFLILLVAVIWNKGIKIYSSASS